jgi:hypothetical protein
LEGEAEQEKEKKRKQKKSQRWERCYEQRRQVQEAAG